LLEKAKRAERGDQKKGALDLGVGECFSLKY